MVRSRPQHGTVRSPDYLPPADPLKGTRSAPMPLSCSRRTIARSNRAPFCAGPFPPLVANLERDMSMPFQACAGRLWWGWCGWCRLGGRPRRPRVLGSARGRSLMFGSWFLRGQRLLAVMYDRPRRDPLVEFVLSPDAAIWGSQSARGKFAGIDLAVQGHPRIEKASRL
jgi:hypothetical protein